MVERGWHWWWDGCWNSVCLKLNYESLCKSQCLELKKKRKEKQTQRQGKGRGSTSPSPSDGIEVIKCKGSHFDKRALDSEEQTTMFLSPYKVDIFILAQFARSELWKWSLVLNVQSNQERNVSWLCSLMTGEKEEPAWWKTRSVHWFDLGKSAPEGISSAPPS